MGNVYEESFFKSFKTYKPSKRFKKKKLCKSLVHMNVLHILFLEIKLFIYHMVRNLIPPVKISSKSGIRDKGYHYVTDDRCYTKLMYRVSSS